MKRVEDLAHLKKRFLKLLIFGLTTLFLGVAAIAIFYREQIHIASLWVLENFGFTALAGLVYVSDTFVSPVPPDAVLLIVANGALADEWWFYVTILALCSTLAGYTGWILGYYVSKGNWAPESLRKFANGKQDQVEKYGAWAVALGALTPFPFSITCWSAGFLHMSFRTFSLGALTRIPRIYIYYWVIRSALWVPGQL